MDINEFLVAVVQGGVPWVDLESEKMMFTIPSGIVPRRNIF